MLAVAIVIGVLWFTNRAVTPKEATWEDVLGRGQTGRIPDHQDPGFMGAVPKRSPGSLLVDTRQEWEYRTGHIQGALNFPIEPTGYSRWRKQKPLETFLGPDKNRFIVFY